MNRLSRIIATGLYSGYSPWAPGTVGSALALVIYWIIPGFSGIRLLAVSVVLFFIGVWAATKVEETDGRDASIINVDEIVGMWISLLFLPADDWYWIVAAFFMFRAFDIFKPFPVGKSQKLSRGWGVMIDDVLAAFYTNLLLRLITWIFTG